MIVDFKNYLCFRKCMFGFKTEKLHKAQMTRREDGFSVLGHITAGNLGIIHRRMVLRTKTQYFHQCISSISMAYTTMFTVFYTFGNSHIFVLLNSINCFK